MKMVTAENKQKLVVGRNEWLQTGLNAGWIRTAADGLQIKTVFHNQNGFVTDFGESLPLRDTSTNEVVMDVPRYGVWQHDPRKGKPQVTFTTNDLEEAKRVLGA
jgi:hypothetical protein